MGHFTLKPMHQMTAYVGTAFLALSKKLLACEQGTGDGIQMDKQTLPV